MSEEPIYTQFLKALLDPQNIKRYDLLFKAQVEKLLNLMGDYFLEKIPPEEFLSRFASRIHGVKIWLKEIQEFEAPKETEA